MNSETEIVLALLKDVNKQLEERESAETAMNYIHPKWGTLIFKLKTREIVNPDFENGTLAIIFSINECRTSLKAGDKKQIIRYLKELINNPKSIIEDIPNYYRMLFDYSASTDL